MQVELRVARYDPEADRADGPPHYQDYQVEVPDYATVLDSLIKVREEQDGTLALRCSCRSSICGSCAMRINGQARLACKTRLARDFPRGGPITVEPAGNLPVIKDLVVDMTPFWDKVRAVRPYLQPHPPEPEREYQVENHAMLDVAAVMNCIMCGACVSDCTVLEVDDGFLGPAALAKAYRFVADPRDGLAWHRLRDLSGPGGIWDCTHCYYCVEVCPKGVAPLDRILQLREQAMAVGFTENNGSRHSRMFAKTVEHTGWLDENRLAVGSLSLFDIPGQAGMAVAGLRMLIHRKMPPVLHRARPGAQYVRKLFKKLENHHDHA